MVHVGSLTRTISFFFDDDAVDDEWNVEKDVASFFSSLFIASRIFPRVTLSMPLRDVSSSLPQMVDMINEFAPLFGTFPRARRMGNRFHRCLMNAICRMSPLSLSSSMLGAEVDMKSFIIMCYCCCAP